MTRYDLIARLYDPLLKKVEESSILPLRKLYVPLIEGKVLDVAVGTGNNIQFYPPNSNVTLVDKSEKMLNVAKEKVKNRKDLFLKFIVSPLERLPFEDETFDMILSIDVFCSVKRPMVAMKELKRVLKTNGHAIFVEHGKTGNKWVDFMLYLTNILTYPTVGSSMTRRPLKYIKEVGFIVKEVKEMKGTFRYIYVTKAPKNII